MKKALFFGGSFNPVTVAHVALADFVRQQMGFDYVIFVPAKSHYILSTEKKSFSFSEQERLEMLKKVSLSHPWMLVSSLEIDSPVQPRTYLTLKTLREEGYELKLLFGSDWLKKLSSDWLYIKEICQEFGIVVMKRNNDRLTEVIDNDEYLTSIKPYLTLIETPDFFQGVSSTKIREAIVNGNLNEEVKRMIPQELDGLEAYLGRDEK
ncbi:MAG: hypothetical protein WCR67_00700 [Bacilli bacterium]